MGRARTKLNFAYTNGCLLIAGVFGALTGSWAVFWITLAVTIGGGFYSGDIRPTPGKR